MRVVRHWIETHFSYMLFLGVAAGLFVPYLDKLPNITPVVLVGMVMFFSCSKISLQQVQMGKHTHFLLFYVLRFVALPALLYVVAHALIPAYAMGILLVALMPMGAASTAVAGMTGGNPTFALLATIFTNIIAPFSIPLLLWAMSGEKIEIHTTALFFTLAGCIFLPASFYAIVKKAAPHATPWIRYHSQFAITLLLALMVACVVAYRRSYFFENILTSGMVFALVCGFYALLYGVGVLFACRMPRPMMITYGIVSGVNNIALSAALAVLYFSSDTVVFTVLGEIAWVVGISSFKRALHNHA